MPRMRNPPPLSKKQKYKVLRTPHGGRMILKKVTMRIIAPNYAKYLLEEQLINSNFEFKCKQCGIDNVTIEKMKNEARELSIRTIHTYEDCLTSLLRNKIKEIYNSQL